MAELEKWPIVLCCALLLGGIATPASAQHVILNAPVCCKTKIRRLPPPVARAPTALWPRLDPGAVLCRTEDDLDRHAANMIARVSGAQQQIADCPLSTDRPVSRSSNREGPGRTQVKLAGPDGETGWTDVWLPDKPPPR